MEWFRFTTVKGVISTESRLPVPAWRGSVLRNRGGCRDGSPRRCGSRLGELHGGVADHLEHIVDVSFDVGEHGVRLVRQAGFTDYVHGLRHVRRTFSGLAPAGEMATAASVLIYGLPVFCRIDGHFPPFLALRSSVIDYLSQALSRVFSCDYLLYCSNGCRGSRGLLNATSTRGPSDRNHVQDRAALPKRRSGTAWHGRRPSARLAKSQMAGDGGRRRAAGAVRVRVVDATGTEPGDLAIRLDKHVTRVMRAVAALDEHCEQPNCRPADQPAVTMLFSVEMDSPFS